MTTPRARKDLGQHFLHDNNVINKIVLAIAPKPADRIVEIGPGLGAITARILATTHRLDVIEIDDAVIDPLKKQCEGIGELTIHHQDVLTFDFNKLSAPLRVVGNLPYNISSPLIFHLLDHLSQIADMHFMLQKEVVDRMAAQPGSKIYGRLSVMVQYFCDVDYLFTVGPNCFRPLPKVDSAVVRLIPKTKRAVTANNISTLSKVVKAAFGQRRKTLRNCLKALITDEQLASIGIDGSTRAEQLNIDDFVRISNSI